MEYTFATISRYDLSHGTSSLLSLLDSSSAQEITRVFGQILTLFGEPMYIRQNMDEAYVYHVLATDSNEKQFVLTLYHGKSGPVIGGNQSTEGILDAANALKKLIKSTSPTDFKYTGYYSENETKIQVTMKISDKQITYSETKAQSQDNDLGVLRILPNERIPVRINIG